MNIVYRWNSEFFVHDVAVDMTTWIRSDKPRIWNTGCDDKAFLSHSNHSVVTRGEHINRASGIATLNSKRELEADPNEISPDET